MQRRRFLIYTLLLLSSFLYGQTAIGLKIRGVGFHFMEMNQDPAIFENSVLASQTMIVEPGYELNFQKFLYSTILSVEFRQGIHSDAAAKMAGHIGVGLRWKFFHKKRSSICISVAPILSYRRTWNDIPQYVNHSLYKDYKTTQWYQYKYLIGAELVYNIFVGKRSDISFALSYNNSFQTIGVSLGYRYWINPYVKVKDKGCSSCGTKSWNRGRFRKFWRRIWR